MIAFWKHSAKYCEKRSGRTMSQGLLLVWTVLLLSCASQQKLERRQGDHVELGRRVPPRAYAWYARARYLHRLGQVELARHAYEAVLADDPRSGSAFAGLGSTYCASDRERAEATFSRGLRRAVESLPVYLARGRCELGWGEPDRAVTSARAAFARDPSSSDASALLADALAAVGKPAEAERVRRGQKLFAGTHDLSPSTVATPGDVDLALAGGNYALAESLALELMPRSRLAVRAFALGKWTFAEQEAALISAAAPGDQEAWAVLALTREGSPSPNAEGGALGDLVSCLWAEHLRAETGPLAAEVFLSALGLGAATSALQHWRLVGDPLLTACAERLARGVAGPLAKATTISARP